MADKLDLQHRIIDLILLLAAQTPQQEKNGEELMRLVQVLLQELRDKDETIKYYQKQLYGSKSEKANRHLPDPNQLTLFDLEYPELNPQTEVVEDQDASSQNEEEQSEKSKKKKKRSRQNRLANLPHEEVIIKPREEEKYCPYCNTPMEQIGKKYTGTKVEIIPAKVVVKDYYAPVYKCPTCEIDGETTIVQVKGDTNINGGIPKSECSVELLAYIINERFFKGMPYNRIHQELKYNGYHVDRRNLSNWVIFAAMHWLYKIYNRMRALVVSSDYLHCDETPFIVLGEEGRANTTKSWFWVFSTIKEALFRIRLFHYNPSRAGYVVKEFLQDFKGTLITDGWNAYNAVENVERAVCWAHARRKFFDAIPDGTEEEVKQSVAGQALAKIQEFFIVEKEISNLTPAEKKAERSKRIKPLVISFFEWVQKIVDEKSVSSKKTKTALNYCLNYQEELSMFLADGNIPATNSIAERSIRPFSVGRKAWLFAGGPKGAETSAILYSLVETAKANHLCPYKYFMYLLQRLPYIDENDTESLDQLLPWSEEVVLACSID